MLVDEWRCTRWAVETNEMQDSSQADPSRWHRHVVVNAIRALALDRQQQEALRPPFAVSTDVLFDCLQDGLEHARCFQTTMHKQVLSDVEQRDIEQLAVETRGYSDRSGMLSHGEAAEPDPNWDSIRVSARELLRKHGWEGNLDVRLFQYVDPDSGVLVTPAVPGEEGSKT